MQKYKILDYAVMADLSGQGLVWPNLATTQYGAQLGLAIGELVGACPFHYTQNLHTTTSANSV
jgi:hypothetical protein